MKRTQSGWAIVGKHGLYVDWRQTKKAMIAKHVHDCCQGGEERPSEFVYDTLDNLQRERWKRCQKAGDRAVRVTIIWNEY